MQTSQGVDYLLLGMFFLDKLKELADCICRGQALFDFTDLFTNS